MLQKFFVHLSLIIVFAFTQIGVATHEISHLSDLTQQTQQDQNAPNHPCEQCISHAGVANGLATSVLEFVAEQAVSIILVTPATQFLSADNSLYSARDPPQTA